VNLANVPLDKIHWNKRFREDLGDIESLTASIREKGIIQPITVTPDFELLAGERRVTAARAAGLTEIPALLRAKTDAVDAREIELLENIARKDFEWPERASLTAEIDRLLREKNLDWSTRQTAAFLERSKTNVARDVKLASYIEVVPELAALKTADEAEKVIKKIEEKAIVEELRNRQIREIASDGLDKGLAMMLKIADSNYRVGDTFKGLSELRSGSGIHVIECDPPYGIDLQEMKRSKDNAASNIHSYEEIDEEDYPNFLLKLSKELYRVAHTNSWLIFWFGPSWQSEVLSALRAGQWQVDEIPAIWTKTQGQTMQPEIYLGRAYEPFYLARKGSPVLLKRGRLNVFDFPTVPGSQKYHPTERPVPLIQELLETLATPRQMVLVPFLGSGATLRAAYNAGMQGFGWDLNAEYKPHFMLKVEADTKAIGGNTGES